MLKPRVTIEVILTDKAVLDAIKALNAENVPYSVDKIAERVGCSRRTVFNALNRLRGTHVKIEKGVGQAVKNKYEVVV